MINYDWRKEPMGDFRDLIPEGVKLMMDLFRFQFVHKRLLYFYGSKTTIILELE